MIADLAQVGCEESRKLVPVVDRFILASGSTAAYGSGHPSSDVCEDVPRFNLVRNAFDGRMVLRWSYR